MDEIERQAERVQKLRGELIRAEDTLRDMRTEAAPFKVGDVAEARAGGKYVPAIVREVNAIYGSVWYKVSVAKKDGSWSKQVIHAFSDVRALGSEG